MVSKKSGLCEGVCLCVETFRAEIPGARRSSGLFFSESLRAGSADEQDCNITFRIV